MVPDISQSAFALPMVDSRNFRSVAVASTPRIGLVGDDRW